MKKLVHDLTSWQNNLCFWLFTGTENPSSSLLSPLSWEQKKTQMDTVCCPLFSTATCSFNIFSPFLDPFDILRSHNFPSSSRLCYSPRLPTHHSFCFYCACRHLPFPPGRGSHLRIIAFDRRGLWLWDWALSVESTGSIPPIPPFGSYCAWWQCWHSTCSPPGLIKSAASIWMQGQRGPRQHGHMCTTVQYTKIYLQQTHR